MAPCGSRAQTPPAPATQTATEHAPLPASAREAIARLEAPRLVSRPAVTEEPGSPAARAPADRAAKDLAERLGRLTLAELLRETKTPGLSLAYFEDFAIQWAFTWGVANASNGEPVTTGTLFQAASISKPVAALAVIQAAEAGLLDLDAPVNRYLTQWRLPENEHTQGRPVTPRMLLAHAAGTTVHGFPGYSPDIELPTLVQVLDGAAPANTAAVRVDIGPWTLERYSGGGTTILQLLLSEVMGRPFPEILEERVLQPIGMADSRYDQPIVSERAARAARAHLGTGVAGTVPWHVYPELAAAGLWTTPTDLARFATSAQRALRGDAVGAITPKIAQLMTTPAGVGSFALGFQTQDRGNDALGPVWYFGHSGGNWGFRSNLLAHRDRGYGYAVMTNGSSFDVILELQRRIVSLFGWQGDFSVPPRNWPDDEP